MDKILSDILKDPFDKAIVIVALFLAVHFFKKQSNLIDEKIENKLAEISGLDVSLKGTAQQIKNQFENFKSNITQLADGIKREFYELKRDIIDYQSDVFKQIQDVELESRKNRIKTDGELRERITKVEEKLSESNKKYLEFSKRVVQEIKEQEKIAEMAKDRTKQVFEGHKKRLDEIERKIAKNGL